MVCATVVPLIMYFHVCIIQVSHGATDVTGFGLLGHAKNLASAQKGCCIIQNTFTTRYIILYMYSGTSLLGTPLIKNTSLNMTLSSVSNATFLYLTTSELGTPLY